MKLLIKSALALVLLFSGAAFVAAQPALYVEGTHYETIDKPVRTADPNKIEVTEVFWYGCPHCYAFEPLLDNWVSKLPADVAFVRSPGMWNSMMETHAQIYYVEQALGIFDKTHQAVFDEIHKKGNYLEKEDAIKTFFVSQGVNPDEFTKAWNSFGVTSAVKQASTRMRDYGIRGVPNLIINGKYRITTGEGVTTQEEMLKVADFLIAKERKSS